MTASELLRSAQVDLVVGLIAVGAVIVWLALSRRAWTILKRSVTHPFTKEIVEIADRKLRVRAVGGANGD